MNPILVAALIGAGLVGSLALGISAITGTGERDRPPSRWAARARWIWFGPGTTLQSQRRHQAWVLGALAAGVLAWIISGIPVAAPLVAVAVPGVPWLLSAGREEQRTIARVEAVEAWTRRLRDVEDSGVGLQEAIVDTAQTAPAAIAADVQLLAARIQAGWDVEAALYAFAEALRDPVSDQVVVALALHLSDRGARLADALTGIAEAAADEVAMRRETASKRSRARFQIRFLTVGSVLLVGFGLASGQYTAPYAEPRGQVVLAILACGFIGCLWWARTLSLPPAEERFLSTNTSAGGTSS
ncbi:type II secretion system F family protein [Micromonospora aurantiaca (nom. illeg.)]|uniref:type II secretion system F family protein n=1 Tax=Micromonospora aurantiaca (nom. illeg.) TaxID=47850 RepID=UPI0008292A04|nr:type II secretion system F family protein [Micromonospora aurantiaca]SCL36236.1 Flp pilus assembly protein TadB [Micromonospora aurantiaca]